MTHYDKDQKYEVTKHSRNATTCQLSGIESENCNSFVMIASNPCNIYHHIFVKQQVIFHIIDIIAKLQRIEYI